MFSRTKHKDEAWLLHQWLANKETSQARFAEVGVPGARVDGWNDPAVVASRCSGCSRTSWRRRAWG